MDLERLGTNIRSLRRLYRETQEQLGEAIYVEKNTISNYEKGKREPNNETLVAIAKHYGVSIEELLYEDFCAAAKLTVDDAAVLANIHTVFPIITSEKTLENEHFKNALDIHMRVYDSLGKGELALDEMLEKCLADYYEAEEDNDIKIESSANILALWFFVMMSMESILNTLFNPQRLLKAIDIKDELYDRIIENIDFIRIETKKTLDLFNDRTKEKRLEMLKIVKDSAEWHDLADYYLALQYVGNLEESNLSLAFNKTIGIEMIIAFAKLGNVYANNYLKKVISIVGVDCSQFVNDR